MTGYLNALCYLQRILRLYKQRYSGDELNELKNKLIINSKKKIRAKP